VQIEDPEIRERVYGDVTKQFGQGQVQAIALDQTQCGFSPNRPARYNFFRQVRPAVSELPPGRSWRDCDLKDANVAGLAEHIQLDMDISPAAMASLDRRPVTQYFRIIVVTPEEGEEEVECLSPAGF
jgi:hypothetical protein